MSIERIQFEGILKEMVEWSNDYSQKLFRDKIMRVYVKCLRSNRILLATKIAEKYRKELTTDLRSDLPIAVSYALFAANVQSK